MKCEVIINPDNEEKVIIYAKENSERIEEIKNAVLENSADIFAYDDNEIIKLKLNEVCYITTSGNKIYAFCEKEKYLLKERLFSLEEKLPKNFVKINQSCLANINKMERFDTSVSGTLKILFKNGDVDYVSRRQLKTIKERIGI